MIGRRIGAAVTVVTLALTASAFAYVGHVKRSVEHARKLLRSAVVSVHSVHVDDCGGLVPEPSVDLPTRLSTPVAYMNPRDFQDPFGKSGETLFYIPEKYYTNATDFMMFSRGPDGDFDSKAVPRELHAFEPIILPAGTSYKDDQDSSHRVHHTDYDFGKPLSRVVEYTTPDGVTHQNNSILLHVLPPRAKSSAAGREAFLINWLASHGVMEYDPTNGLISDGDVFHYSK